MKKLLLLFFTVVAVGLFAAQESDPSLLFYASFDSYSTDPDYAKGFKKTTTAALRDLQLRMFNGVADQKNALELSNRESVWYDAPKNIDPRKSAGAPGATRKERQQHRGCSSVRYTRGY